MTVRLLAISCLIACTLLLSSRVASARVCFDWPAIFEKNRSLFNASPGERKIFILPFINDTGNPRSQWLAEAFRLGLFLALEQAKNGDVIELHSRQTTFEPGEAVTLGQAVGADYVIAGQYHIGDQNLQVFTHFVDVKAGGSLELNEEVIEWPNPQKFTELLVYLARRASKAFDKIKVDKKKLKRTQNEPRSLAAFESWTLGTLADEKGTEREIAKARDHFAEAIKNDFNYCYGYLGLAQAWAELGFIEKLKGKPYKENYQKAQKELTKVALLCPDIAKTWKDRVTQYLQADIFQSAGADLAKKGEWGAASGQLEKGIALLPGDVLARGQLQRIYQQRGKGAQASEQAAIIASLAHCR